MSVVSAPRAQRRLPSSAAAAAPSCPLALTCVEEALSEAQKNRHNTEMAAFKDQMAKLTSLAKKGATVTNTADGVQWSITETSRGAGAANTSSSSAASTPARSPAAIGGQKRLLVDPRTGAVLGTLDAAQSPAAQAPTPVRLLSSSPAVRSPAGVSPASQRAVNAPTLIDLTKSAPAMTPAAAAAAEKLKEWPLLSVQPKVQKQTAALPTKRAELDSKVKQLLIQSQPKFTEWLMQQGLVPPEQTLRDSPKAKLKLAMYSDSKKFPHSGGYVWMLEAGGGKANKYVSVYKCSLFEQARQSPTVILKLVYHWSCQTNIQNVVQWVKVDHTVINRFYEIFRALCVGAVNEELVNLGGQGRYVEVGVISLGTSSKDLKKKETRVEIMGVLDRATGRIRLRCTDPRSHASTADKFKAIFGPLPVWVQKQSKIIADNSIDREKIKAMGFANVVQSGAGTRKDGNNSQIMDYLKKTVPKVFQSTLPSLKAEQIQMFLDELSYRESCAPFPLAAFNGLVDCISSQTGGAVKQGSSLVLRAKSIIADPFKDWRLTHKTDPSFPSQGRTSFFDSSISSSSPGSKRPLPTTGAQSIAKRSGPSTEMIGLESYFYATLQGDKEVLSKEFKADMAFKCHLCKKLFMNNIEFMKHLSLHVESDRDTAVDIADLSQCKYCFKDFDSTFSLQAHMDEKHLLAKVDSGFMAEGKPTPIACQICEERFESKAKLILHMGAVHVAAEMPYHCTLCGLRCSFHRELVDHFQESHDRTDKLQCPLCLKTFSLSPANKGYDSNVASQFVSHLQTHQGKKAKCKRCCLTFFAEKEVREHVIKDHASYKGFENLEEYQYMSTEESTQMPKPDERNFRMASKKSVSAKGSSQQSAFAAQNLEDLLIFDIDQDTDACGECKKRMATMGHYNAYLCCTKCRFSTCCSKSMTEHVRIFHGPGPATFKLGNPIILENEVFCCCGFKTNSGNKMAKHLSASGCKTAYPTQDEATKNVRQTNVPMETDDVEEISSFNANVEMAMAYQKKPEEENKKEGEEKEPEKQQSGPLAFLGLQRTNTEEEEADSAKEKEAENKNDGNEKEGASKTPSENEQVSAPTASPPNGAAADGNNDAKEADAQPMETATTTEKDSAIKESVEEAPVPSNDASTTSAEPPVEDSPSTAEASDPPRKATPSSENGAESTPDTVPAVSENTEPVPSADNSSDAPVEDTTAEETNGTGSTTSADAEKKPTMEEQPGEVPVTKKPVSEEVPMEAQSAQSGEVPESKEAVKEDAPVDNSGEIAETASVEAPAATPAAPMDTE